MIASGLHHRRLSRRSGGAAPGGGGTGGGSPYVTLTGSHNPAVDPEPLTFQLFEGPPGTWSGGGVTTTASITYDAVNAEWRALVSGDNGDAEFTAGGAAGTLPAGAYTWDNTSGGLYTGLAVSYL